ncbi:MBL fold metallo-hydrolase [Vibrio stylophorae]|nr:MBL fold metallo-hydrolase [Vibrio stylophorae]
MSLKFKIIPVTAFQQNCSLVWCDETMKGVVIDPGGDCKTILSVIAEKQVDVTAVVLTHGHLDHVGGSVELAKALNVSILGPHQEDRFWLENLPEQSQMFGFAHTEAFEPARWLEEGDVIEFGQSHLTVLHTPGHTPGHVTLVNEDAKVAFVGDVLFNGSIGRTDFPKGDHATLIQAIKTKLWPLGNEVTFVPGHGPTSTFGYERRTNPFVADEMPLY